MRGQCQIAVCSPSRNSFMTGRRPNSTLVWNFYNSFREAQCPDTEVGMAYSGTALKTWSEPDGQQSGGAGGCCTTCTGDKACVGWVYKGVAGEMGGTCTTLSSITAREPCAPHTAPEDWECGGPADDGRMCDGHNHTLPCISGGKGRFPQFTSMPQHFKNHGFLTMGVGKLFHDGERTSARSELGS